MRLISRLPLVLLMALGAIAVFIPPVGAQVSLTTLGTPYTQSFDSLPASGSATWTNNSTIPGWFHARTGTGTTIVANNGSSNAGNLYSYGTGTATDRALGSVGSGNAAVGNLFWGVRLQNNTGATITALDVSYTGEQWRNSSAAAQTVAFSYLVGSPTVTGTLAEFQSAGVAVASLDFTGPITGGAAVALDGNLAANRVTLTFSIGGLSIPNGTEVMLRWSDQDHASFDHGLSVDDFAVTPQGGVVTPALNINDVTLAEGNPPGTTTFTFAVTLTAPAGPGGVTFDIATADGTAEDANPLGEDDDYVAQSLTGQSIPMGSTGPYNFSVTVNRDTDVEPNETFFVNVTNIVGANPGDVQGQGTIDNDDVALTPIHDIQGPGGSSPLSGTVTTTGIVTGRKSNGFFIQEPDASVDADPLTSEGIFVFTSSAPPAAAALGNLVQVTGTIAEFVPTAALLQPPLTELTSPTTVQLSTGNPLPAAIPLTATFPDPAGAFDQLERLEGMRVSVASLTVGGPTLGNSTNEPNATQTSNGVFLGTVTGVPRARREPGIQAPDPAPSGSIPPIPRFDSNPELLRVDSDGLTGAPPLDVGSSAVVTGLVGPLDYTSRRYTILPDPPPASPPVAAGGPSTTTASVPTGTELTVGAYNMERFFDTVNDPGIGEPVLTATAFDNRLNKASLGIRNHLRMPDILGAVEIENLSTLQAIAARINGDAVAAAQPDPMYVAYLEEGNDIGGIDVGFLVKTAEVAAGVPRVTVNAVVQENAGELFVNPDSSTSLLNDRPSLRLDAVVNDPNGATFPVTVIVNHLRSFNDVNSIAPGSSGWATDGDRVRAKRQKQAESLANLVQARQTADAAERIILVGDFNAYEFSDGLADLMNVISGTPPPDNETVVPGDGVDLVNPDLDNLFDTPPPPERYSYIFDGQTQNIDHVVVNAALTTATSARRVEHPRINADFPAVDRNDPSIPRHLSDHDPIVGFFDVAAFATADLSITKVEGADLVTAGTNFVYTITVTNDGPDAAESVSWSDDLPAGTTFVSLSAPAGWSCLTPPMGSGGTVSCSISPLPVGSAGFTLTVAVGAGVAAGTVLSNTAVLTSTTADADTDDLSAEETTTVAAAADLSLTKTDSVDPIVAGGTQTYTITVTNGGPSDAASVSWIDTLPAGTTFLSLTEPGGWSCGTPAVGSGGMVSCSRSSLGVASPAIFTLEVVFDPSLADGTLVTNEAITATTTPDASSLDDSGEAETTVSASGDFYVIAPCRAVDTRAGAPLQDGLPVTFVFHGTCGIPLTASTVVLNATVVGPTGAGDLTLWAGDATPPAFSTMAFPAGATRALMVVVSLSQDAAGEIAVQAAVAGNGTVDLVLDVLGYFE